MMGKVEDDTERRTAQPHEELCRFAAAAGAIFTADFIGRGYENK